MTLEDIRHKIALLYIDLDHLEAANTTLLSEYKSQLSELLNDLPTDVETTQPKDVSDHIDSMLARFETDHPAIAHAAHDMVDKLARMGI